jgi:hypothetical protein
MKPLFPEPINHMATLTTGPQRWPIHRSPVGEGIYELPREELPIAAARIIQLPG